MTFDDFRESLQRDGPPRALDHALTALWWDAKGDWKTAHESAQQDESPRAAWVHAYLHRKEGDFSNASYWTGAPAKRLLRAPWSTSGVKSRRRCWRNSLSGLHLQRRQLFARELLPAFHERCRRLMHFGNGLRRLHGWRCVHFLQHGQQFHKGAAHSSEAISLRPPSAAPPCPLQRLQFLNGGVNLDSLRSVCFFAHRLQLGQRRRGLVHHRLQDHQIVIDLL